MRTRTFILALLAGVGVATGIAAAAPNDQKTPDSSTSSPAPGDTPAAGRGRLGFAAVEISPGLRAFFGAPSDRGVLVDQLRPDSPAARAGLRVGDVILEVDAAPARSVHDIIEAIADRKRGDLVPLRVVRGKAIVALEVKLDTDPGPRGDEPATGGWQRIGPGTMPLELNRWFGDADLRRDLDATRKRLDELERRVQKLEHR
jgi:membrane-associated protease RseP (regulator of RpoE activity)